MSTANSFKCLYLTISGDVTSVKPLRTKAGDKYTTITLYLRIFLQKITTRVAYGENVDREIEKRVCQNRS